MGVLCVVWVRGVPEGVVGQARGLTQEHAGLPPTTPLEHTSTCVITPTTPIVTPLPAVTPFDCNSQIGCKHVSASPPLQPSPRPMRPAAELGLGFRVEVEVLG